MVLFDRLWIPSSCRPCSYAENPSFFQASGSEGLTIKGQTQGEDVSDLIYTYLHLIAKILRFDMTTTTI